MPPILIPIIIVDFWQENGILYIIFDILGTLSLSERVIEWDMAGIKY